MEGSPSPAHRPRGPVLLAATVVVTLAVVLAVALALEAGVLFPPPDTPPRGLWIEVIPQHPDDATPTTFFAQVSDDRTPTSAIQVRWSWQTGGWDTDWSTNKVVHHLFAAGTYAVRLEAMDAAGLTSTAMANVTVLHAPPRALRIGTVLSLTGSLGPFGTDEQNGVDMALAEINAAGGVMGMPVQVFHTDDQTTPSVAQQDAQVLVALDHVAAIIGATATGSCVSVASVAAANHVVEVSPSCANPIFSYAPYTGGWFARTVVSDALQADVAAHFARFNLSMDYTAVIGINNAYGTDTVAEYATAFLRDGGTLTDNPPLIITDVSGGATDYSTQLTQIMSASPPPQLIYLVAYPPDGVLMMNNWESLLGSHPSWASVRWMFSEGLYDQNNFINPLVSAGVNVSAFLGTAPAAYAGVEPAAYPGWATAYQARYGSPPSPFAANAYDAAYVVALAAQASHNTTGDGLRSALAAVANPPGALVGPGAWSSAVSALAGGQGVNYEGASGSVNVNATGDVPSGMIIWGVNATDRLVTKEIFDEALVVSILPAGTFQSPAFHAAVLVAAAWADRQSP